MNNEEIEDKKREFEMLLGSISSPSQVERYSGFVARRTGRTHAMLMALPQNKPCIVVAHSALAANFLRTELRHLRPDYDIRLAKFMSSSKFENSYRATVHKDVPVFVDNAVTDELATKYVRWANRGKEYHG